MAHFSNQLLDISEEGGLKKEKLGDYYIIYVRLQFMSRIMILRKL